jgi:hypothetical protein
MESNEDELIEEEDEPVIETRTVANPNRTVITTDVIGGGISKPEQNKRFK